MEIIMAIKFRMLELIIFVFYSMSIEGHNISTYCLVEADAPGIFIPDLVAKKDSSYAGAESQYLDNTTQSVNITTKITQQSHWKLINSIGGSNHIKHPVVDQRWEKFKQNYEETKLFQDILEKKDLSVFFSIRWYGKENKNHPYFDKNQWYELMTKNSQLYLCNGSDCSHLLKPEESNGEFYIETASTGAVWKIHYYYYLYTTQNGIETIYEKADNCTTVEEGCFSIYLAMCSGCAMELSLASQSGTLAKNFNGNGTWIKEHIPLKSFTHNCFNISAKTYTTKDTSDPFWAIGDVVYISSNYGCRDNKRVINVTYVTSQANITDIMCETADNRKFNFTSELPVPKKITKNKEPLKKSSFNPLYLIYILPVVLVVVMTGFAAYIICKIKKIGPFDFRQNRNENEYVELVNLRRELSSTKTKTQMSCTVKRIDFDEYLKKVCNLSNNDNLSHQFSNLPYGYKKNCTEGSQKKNLAKNKFPNVLPYDDNRVKIKEKKNSSYINASYIQGVSSYKEYIATQNPLENTVEGFWKMVWQTKVNHIVMVTSTDETFYRYWPEKQTLSVIYGDIEIDLDNIVNYEFYTYRIFRVRKKGVVKQVNQLHYHSWSNENLMSSSHTFVDFMKQILKIPHLSIPVLVHCESGIGRSGTILLCDVVLRTLPITETIDMFSTTKALRKCRANMVSTLEEYMVAHFIVRDILKK